MLLHIQHIISYKKLKFLNFIQKATKDYNKCYRNYKKCCFEQIPNIKYKQINRRGHGFQNLPNSARPFLNKTSIS